MKILIVDWMSVCPSSDELHDDFSPKPADQSARADALLSFPRQDKYPLIFQKEVCSWKYKRCGRSSSTAQFAS